MTTYENGPPRHPSLLDELEAVILQILVEHLQDALNLSWVGANYRMQGLAEEAEECLVVAGSQVEEAIVEDPVVVPVEVVDSMLPDVASCVSESMVRRRHRRQVEYPREEARFFQTAIPIHLLDGHGINNVAAGKFGNLHDHSVIRWELSPTIFAPRDRGRIGGK